MSNSRFRCAVCRLYFDVGTLFRQAGLSRYCSTECYSRYLDDQRKKGKAKVKKAESVAHRAKRRSTAPKIPVDVRMAVRERDGGLCRFCGGQGSHCHHVRYRSEGGPDTMDNLVLLCVHCHSLVHSSKAAFQPVLLEYLQLQLAATQRALFVPDVARQLLGAGQLSELQQQRFGFLKKAS